MTRRSYFGPHITVTFDGSRCLHAAECVRGLPEVFDTKRKPWISPQAAAAEEIAQVVRRCPAGALEYGPGQQDFGASPETPPAPAQVKATPDGPLWIRGAVEVMTDQGPNHLNRVALCRCGRTENRPFCDASGDCTGWRG
ncbi:MAG: (4Fe-4S)-binding protein [Propionibacteriaceae bacterium]|jgi:uncharacterized Fe-S cluster protein YjdI|nr:(4Fe-4S)-binding protein [Propionibacteriaceae bacterium]